jgi:hypothetical protein
MLMESFRGYIIAFVFFIKHDDMFAFIQCFICLLYLIYHSNERKIIFKHLVGVQSVSSYLANQLVQ